MAKQASEQIKPFSQQLESWLKSPGKKTIDGLNRVFGEKTFAIGVLLLLAPSSLPLPTGGLTNLFELVAMILALEMIAGRRSVWLPKSLLHHQLSGAAEKKALPFFMRRIRWFEKFSRPRMTRLIANRASASLIGVFFLLFTIGAFVAPPFSGLDTLPSLGVVILALGVILSDSALAIVGVIVGSAGVGLIIALSNVVFDFVRRFIA